MVGHDTALNVHSWLACPVCRGPLVRERSGVRCPADGQHFYEQDGILRLLPAERARDYDAFSALYRMQRERQGWRRLSVEEMAVLPEFAPNGWDRLYWQVRCQSYQLLEEEIGGNGQQPVTPQRILDMGAGIGWLAYRLAAKGHEVVALDLSCDEAFGLGAARRLGQARNVSVALVQGDLEDPPIRQGQVDRLIYNASLHYANDILGCLRAGARLLRPDGALVIMDSPVAAREPTRPESKWPGDRKLSLDRLFSALRGAGLRFKIVDPHRGYRWRLRQFKNWMVAGSTFELPIIVAKVA